MQNIATLQGPASPALREPSDPGTASGARRRIRPGGPPVVVAAAVLVAVIAAVAVAIAGRSSQAPPATGAETIVPGDALAYVHVSVDPGRPAVRQAAGLSSRLPGLTGPIAARLSAIASGGASTDFSRDIRPWLGREAAFALLDTPGSTAGSLIVLGVSRPALARSFLARAGASPGGTYDGARLYRYRTGTEAAFVRGYLALGQDASVRAALDVAARRTGSLRASQAYRSAAAGEPDGRVLDAYVSAAGVRRALEQRAGALGALGQLLDQPALAGATISLSPASGGAAIRVHSAVDPALRRLRGPRPPSFSPTLQDVLPSGSMLLLDTRDLRRAAPRVLSAAATMGVAGRIGPLLARLGSALGAEGVDVQGTLASLFGGETAVAIVPSGQADALVVVSRVRDQSAAQDQLGALEGPLAQLFPPPANGPGQAPVFNDVQVAGVTAHQLVLAPGLQLDYAVFRGLLVVSTSLQGIARIAHHGRSLGEDRDFATALGNRPDHVTSLVFLDFSQLLSLGEQTGLIGGSQLTALRPDLDRIRAIGLDSTTGESDTTAELFLEIS